MTTDRSILTMVRKPPTRVSQATVSKSRLKAHALEYFRQVEQAGGALVVTDTAARC